MLFHVFRAVQVIDLQGSVGSSSSGSRGRVLFVLTDRLKLVSYPRQFSWLSFEWWLWPQFQVTSEEPAALCARAGLTFK